MSKTVVRKNESLEDALRRFKRTVSKTGTLQEYRKREFYEKPSVKRKKNLKSLESVSSKRGGIMGLLERLNEDMKQAMKNKEKKNSLLSVCLKLLCKMRRLGLVRINCQKKKN